MNHAHTLNDQQKEALLALGAPTGEPAMISQDVFAQLLQLGLLHQRSDGSFDLTVQGEAAYCALAGK